MSGRSPPLNWTLIIVPSHHTTVGVINLEHKERYDIITDKEWYILVKV